MFFKSIKIKVKKFYIQIFLNFIKKLGSNNFFILNYII